ncbi:MAG: hypothetical protein OSA48_11220 [Akkermansiaceae bacterium]|jgi:hypothetical protein|nr:hypothetical protein [Akkermansiaceae bacterium]
MKSFQVISNGKPIFFFEVEPDYVDNEPTERNAELANNLAGESCLDLEAHGPKFIAQMISRLPLVISDREPDHEQEGLKAWVSPKIKR